MFTVNWDATVTLRGLTVTGGGNVDVGAGIYNAGDLTLDSARVTKNLTRGDINNSYDHGGGIYSFYGSLHVLNSTIDSNEARYNAGIVFFGDAADTLEIANSVIHNNIARYDGGYGNTGALAVVSSSNTAPLSIVNSTFSGNSAGTLGGIWVDGAAQLDVVNSTITENAAITGSIGGIAVNGSGALVTLHNTIVAGNTDYWNSLDRDVVSWGGSYDPQNSSNNLIGINNNSGLQHGVNGNIIGTASSPVDPGLALLGDYGGPTKSHALLVGSPALDAGSDPQAIDRHGRLLIFDQRDHRRTYDLPDVANTGNGSVDIGAFEAGNPTPITVKVLDDELDDITAASFDPNDMSLREALAIAATYAGADVVRFDESLYASNPVTITLSYDDADPDLLPELLTIDSEVAVEGPGAGLVTISGGNQTGVFLIKNATIRIADLKVTAGYLYFNGSGIDARGAALTLERMVISSNVVADIGAAGASAHAGSLTILDSTIDGNEAWMGTAGIHVERAPLTIIGSTISNNEGIRAGVYFAGETHPLKIVNSTISGNWGIDRAGLIVSTTGATEIINSTIYGNTAESVSAGVSGSNLLLHNTIVANNQVTYDSDSDVDGTFDPASSNNFIGFDPNGYFPAGNGNQVGVSAPLDPKLLPLGNYGGPTKTHAPMPDSPAIDAGWDDVAYAYDLIFDQIGEGFDRILGGAVDIGATESHIIIRPSVGIAIFGTQQDDVITVTDNAVTVDRIGTFSLNIASANEVVVASMSGDDNVSVASLSRAVALFGGDGDDTLTGGSGDDTIFGGQGVNAVNGGAGNNIVNAGGNVDFEPGLVEFSAVPPGIQFTQLDGNTVLVNANPFFVNHSDGDEWQGSHLSVGWDIFPQNFLLNGSLRVEKLAIVQIVKSTFELEAWWPLNGTTFRDWHVDAPSGVLVYPTRSPIWPSSTTQITLNSSVGGLQGILSLADEPGHRGYGIFPVPFRLVHLKQEFETYIVGLEGSEGIQIDEHASSLWWTRTFKSATVYGGIKWYHEIDFNKQTATYNLVGRQVTDTIGTPTNNLTYALHRHFDFDYFVPPT